MKSLFTALALSLFSASAFAGTVYVDANDFASLPDCGGVVQTKIVNGRTQLNLVFSNVVNCSNFDILSANGGSVSYPNQKLQGQERARSGSFTIPSSLIDSGSNMLRVVIQSNSKKTSDTLYVRVKKETSNTGSTSTSSRISMTSTDVRTLNSCGGVVQTKVSNGQLNVIFQNVSNCSNFDIVSANGDRVNYPNMKLGGNEGSRSGSFTLPKKVIDFGGNRVNVLLKSNSGKTSELISIRFIAL
ncbi:MAG: hypothetical protein H7301_00835 [Cryobacterium sp.]|nr:hypothetical protein [Oligoflexia bacterium]